MDEKSKIQKDLQIIASLQRDLNLVTAALLMTGQITIVGIFVNPGGFVPSLSGPLLRNERLEGLNGNVFSTMLIDIIDIILAILLLIDEIGVTSILVGPGRFSIDVTGPIFGVAKRVPALPYLQKDYEFMRDNISKHFKVDSRILNILKKEWP
ncbi:hypothetical protein [Jeotgalibacillus soli]|uniref:Uncharacterized protein n=1 Tax=Jeotgalibacillus soli TaxID=889306 RepID=A0A0C2R4M8_9BACL|nr:hypothetical protein [Jeotgalibacillus soli]KIL45225.1 hypothetical protein KP78_27690 [Jeotgalibacillus soli]